jgi:hypothetical protein
VPEDRNDCGQGPREQHDKDAEPPLTPNEDCSYAPAPPATRFTARNSAPPAEETAGMPTARATRIVRTPTTQHKVDAIRTPVGA